MMMLSSRELEQRRRRYHHSHHSNHHRYHQLLLLLTRIFLLIFLTFVIGDSIKFALGQPLSGGIVIGGRQHDFGYPMFGGGGGGGSNKKKNNNNIVGGGGGGGGGGGFGGRQQSNDDNPSLSGGAVGGGVDAIGINDGGGGSVPIGGGGEEISTQKSFQLSMQEPTCDELRTMWRFSKRQSRAAEITNEIPTYRDPFAYNIWDPLYARSRGLDGLRMRGAHLNERGPPIYGRVVHREQERLLPYPIRVHASAVGDDFNRFYGGGVGGVSPYGYMQRKYPQLRFSSAGGAGTSGGGGGGTALNPNGIAIHQGSFQKLKNLIWTERAKELRDQRREEELAARIAVLKEIANGQSFNVGPNEQQQHQHHQQQQQYKTDSLLMDENRSPDHDRYHHMTNSRLSIVDGQMPKVTIGDDNGHRKHRPQIHSSSSPSSAIFSMNPTSKSGRRNPKIILPQMDSYRSQNHENHRKLERTIDETNGKVGSEQDVGGNDGTESEEEGGQEGEEKEYKGGKDRQASKSGMASFSPPKMSHFRERYRELQKQGLTSPAFYHRSTRKSYKKLFNNEPILPSQYKMMKFDAGNDDDNADYANDVDVDVFADGLNAINDYDDLKSFDYNFNDELNDDYDRNLMNRLLDLYEANNNNNNGARDQDDDANNNGDDNNNNNDRNDNHDGNINHNNYPIDDGKQDFMRTSGLKHIWDNLPPQQPPNDEGGRQGRHQQKFKSNHNDFNMPPANDFNYVY